jgi:WD40 repeat protein
LSFSKEGDLLASSSDDDGHSCHIFDWQQQVKLAAVKTTADPVVAMDCSKVDNNQFMTAGKRGLKIFNYSGNSIKVSKATFAGNEMTDFCCVRAMDNDRVACGGLNGSLYMFNGSQCLK